MLSLSQRNKLSTMETIADLLTAHRGAAIAGLGGEATSHEALRARIEQFGRQLRGAGVGPSDRVAMVLANGPAMAGAFVCMAPWCAAAPLNPACKADEFSRHLADLDARALVIAEGSTSAALDVAAAQGVPVLRLAEGASPGGVGLADVPQAAAKARSAEATALVLHTSGTTARPKMVPLSQANLAASARNIAQTLRLRPGDKCLNVMPLFHIHGLMAPLLASLSAGAAVVCAPGFDALRFFGWLRDARPTWYSAVPAMHQAILARAKRNAAIARASKLRFIRSSSAPLPPQVLARLEDMFGAPVVEAYAMTEAAHQMCSNPLPPGKRRPGFVGPPAGPEVAIMNAAGALLGAGAEGEIVVRGANVMAGYLNNPQANAAAFHDSWFRTGDQGVMDADGFVRVTGRLKEIINRGGEKVAPFEVDEALLAHPAVAEACAFAMPHDALGEEVAAAVVAAGAPPDERDLRTFAARRLADHKVPRRIVVVKEMPKGPTGKVQRKDLAARLELDGAAT